MTNYWVFHDSHCVDGHINFNVQYFSQSVWMTKKKKIRDKDEQRQTKNDKKKESMAHGGVGTLCVSNGLHHQEARQRENGVIGFHHPAFSSLLPFLFLTPFPSHPSLRICSDAFPSSLLSLFTLSYLPRSSRDLLLSNRRSSLIHYIEESRG